MWRTNRDLSVERKWSKTLVVQRKTCLHALPIGRKVKMVGVPFANNRKERESKWQPFHFLDADFADNADKIYSIRYINKKIRIIRKISVWRIESCTPAFFIMSVESLCRNPEFCCGRWTHIWLECHRRGLASRRYAFHCIRWRRLCRWHTFRSST